MQLMRPPAVQVAGASFWDILGALGDFFGGIFAGGALLIAAIAYKRQVDDSRRSQASSITMTLDPPVVRSVPGHEGDFKPTGPSSNPVVKVENVGTTPVYRARVRVTWSNDSVELVGISNILPGGASLKRQLQGDVLDAQLKFVDKSGRYWVRTDGGILIDERYNREPRTLRERVSFRRSRRS